MKRDWGFESMLKSAMVYRARVLGILIVSWSALSSGPLMAAGRKAAAVPVETCPSGSYKGSQHSCIPNGHADCGDGTSCQPGTYCAGQGCAPNGTIACADGAHFCPSGTTCSNDGRQKCRIPIGAASPPSCGPGYHLFFPGGNTVECQINRPGESGGGSGASQSTITGTDQ